MASTIIWSYIVFLLCLKPSLLEEIVQCVIFADDKDSWQVRTKKMKRSSRHVYASWFP